MKFDPHHGGFVSQINVTPFVDVMLVLLIIFMVTAPLLSQGVEVDLPRTKTVKTLPEDSDNLILTIEKDGTINLDDYEVKEDELVKHLSELSKKSDQLLYLRADKSVQYGLVVQVMGKIKEAGISRLGVVAEPEEES